MYFKRCFISPHKPHENNHYFLVYSKVIAITLIVLALNSAPLLAQETSGEPATGASSVDAYNELSTLQEGEQVILSPLPEFDFQAEFFVSRAINQFSNKFPFDILGGNNPDAGGTSCPSYEFFGETTELCILKDIILAVKIPVQIAIALIFYQRI